MLVRAVRLYNPIINGLILIPSMEQFSKAKLKFVKAFNFIKRFPMLFIPSTPTSLLKKFKLNSSNFTRPSIPLHIFTTPAD